MTDEGVWISDDEALALWQRLSGYNSANEPFVSVFSRIKARVGDPADLGPQKLTPASYYKAALASIVFANKDGGVSADDLAEIAAVALDSGAD